MSKSMRRILFLLLTALSAQLLLTACAHDMEDTGSTTLLDLPVSTRTASQTQAE